MTLCLDFGALFLSPPLKVEGQLPPWFRCLWWRLIRACYSNLTAVVKSGSTLSDPFPITRGVKQGSILSPTFFLIVIDKLLWQLKKTSSGISICDLYLGRAVHADVSAIASSATVAEEKGWIIHDFPSENDLKLNSEKQDITIQQPRKGLSKPTGPHSWDHTSSFVPWLPVVSQFISKTWVWNQTSTRPDDNSLLLPPQVVSLDTQTIYLGKWLKPVSSLHYSMELRIGSLTKAAWSW